MKVIDNDKELFKDIINYQMTRNDYVGIELMIRPECNQSCEYCYLYKYGHDLYPDRYSKEQIVNNFKKIIDYFILKEYKIFRLDLFAGDMFYDDLFFELIPHLYTYYTWLKNNYPDFIKYHNETDNNKSPAIIIPSNMSFCYDDEKINKIKQIHNTFLNELGIKIFMSYSTDGRYATNIREKRNIEDEFFDKVLSLCSELNWGLHPMISYESIDNIYENYEWFKLKTYQHKINGAYFLEVRNEGWTKESIEKYSKFLNYVLNDNFHNYCESNLKTYFENNIRLFKKDKDNKYRIIPTQQHLQKLLISPSHFIPCSLGTLNLCIDVGSLELLPCHRTAYKELRGGKLVEENGKIIGVEPSEFFNSYLNLIFYNNDFKPDCVTCPYKMVCMKGCIGAQYEKYADPNISIPSVCDLLKAKANVIIHFYHSIGLFHYLFTTEPEYPINTIYLQLLQYLGYKEYNNYQNLGEYSDYEYGPSKSNSTHIICN